MVSLGQSFVQKGVWRRRLRAGLKRKTFLRGEALLSRIDLLMRVALLMLRQKALLRRIDLLRRAALLRKVP